MPDFRSAIRARLASLDLSPTREAEIVEELSQHLQEEFEAARDRGASENEAAATVLREVDLGALDKELHRIEPRASQEPPPFAERVGSANVLRNFAQDLRYGLRVLRKSPGFTIIAVLALALGIGANSAIFSVVDTVLLRPLPFKNPQQLVVVWENAAHLGFPKNTPSPANFLDWQRQNTVFSGMAALATRSFNLTGAGDPERLDGRRVSANLFDLLGVRPVVGRSFRAEEDKPGTRVAILSYGLWQRRFGSDPAVVGRAINLSGESYTVVGVMPATVHLPGFGEISNDQLWVTIAFPNDEAAERGSHYLDVVARLKPGVTLQQARAEMDRLAAHLATEYPQYNKRTGAVVVPMHEELTGDIRPALLVLLGAVGFVLLIACANVANLLLARAAVRQKEIALRLALGASRARLTQQFLTESLLLALLGGVGGILLAFFGLTILKSFLPTAIASMGTIVIDWRVLVFTGAIALATGLIFGLAPALQASHLCVNDSLKENARDAAGGVRGRRTRSLLVIGEVAVSFVLLIGAGLLVNSFLHLQNLNPGFNPDHLLTAKVSLPETKYPDKEHRSAFFEEVVRHVQTLPGVESVAVANNLPLTYNGDSMPIGVEGRADPPSDERPDVIFRAVGPGYFGTMKIPLVAGRDFNDRDRANAAPVVIVSEKTARHFWPGENPIGKRLKPGSSTSTGPWREVVGVVKDVRQNDFAAEPKLQMYFCYHQITSFPPNALVIRTQVDPRSLAASVRNAVWAVDKQQPVSDLRPMDEIVADAVAPQRFSMLLLAVFAGLALVLAAVGIYGVMSYSVAQRTREIGIRMALGAKRSDMLKMTLKSGMRLVGSGLLIGMLAAFILTRVMAGLLFGISPTDPLTFISISLVLASVAALASCVPAWRAMNVDPMVALRYE